MMKNGVRELGHGPWNSKPENQQGMEREQKQKKRLRPMIMTAPKYTCMKTPMPYYENDLNA